MMYGHAWYQNAIFYHLYPLGLVGAPEQHRIDAAVEPRLDQLYPWIGHAQSLGANALFLGPVFEASTHGYDTRDYYQVDRRLGDNPSFARFSEAVHQCGLRLVLDAVFHHVGREFWAFRDVLEKGENSAYVDWFANIRFGETSPYGDPFSYDAWQGHYALVKLNLANPHVRVHLFDAVRMWMDTFNIDGLRLDAADCIDSDFLRALRDVVKARKEDFWLMGEVVHGNYCDWVNPVTLDSVTNYASYKGLFSSLKDQNYFEIAHTLDNQFGAQGRYKGLYLYNFVDNHDVGRVTSKLMDDRLLYPLYLLLYTMPGIPSIYYGSEWGLQGEKGKHTDAPLRPKLDLDTLKNNPRLPDLPGVLRTLGDIRRGSVAISHGDFRLVFVNHQQFAFTRRSDNEIVLVILNSDQRDVQLSLRIPGSTGEFYDLLNPGQAFTAAEGNLQVSIPPTWGRILKAAS
ncbi:MAG TPA: alpha-amylase family glycosyl hydrolase [Brevefilum sp.]|nr:alpha-amylase family glycosyl hydrolase [Brevefilum sp.]HOR18942.1 alpha-amylase family glycosyl hydrolase [Brevefilum sp.]HPL69379.1 alpha-amylase family glycosyl hydrolase [Brevefilum sp.]